MLGHSLPATQSPSLTRPYHPPRPARRQAQTSLFPRPSAFAPSVVNAEQLFALHGEGAATRGVALKAAGTASDESSSNPLAKLLSGE